MSSSTEIHESANGQHFASAGFILDDNNNNNNERATANGALSTILTYHTAYKTTMENAFPT